MARLACSVETTMSSTSVRPMASQLDNLPKLVDTTLASNTATSSTQNDVVLVIIEALSEKRGVLISQKTANVAALDDRNPDDQRSLLKARDKMEDRLRNLINDLDRRVDARINGLARRNQSSRNEHPRERTRVGRPECFSCG